MIKINNFLALTAILAFIILLRIENTSFASDISQVAFTISILSLLFFGSIYLVNRIFFPDGNDAAEEVEGDGEEKIKLVNEKIFKLQLLSAPSYVVIGFGVYFLFYKDEGALSPHLEVPFIGYGLIIIGVAIEIIIIINLISLLNHRGQLLKKK